MATKTMGASAPVCPQVAIYLAKGAYTADKTTTEGPFVGASKVPAVTALPTSNTLQKGSYKVCCKGCCIGKKRLCGGPAARQQCGPNDTRHQMPLCFTSA